MSINLSTRLRRSDESVANNLQPGHGPQRTYGRPFGPSAKMRPCPNHRVNENELVPLRLEWDGEVDAGYLYLTEIGKGEAVTQRVIENPVAGLGDVILDFDREGRLLGVEFQDHRVLPPGLAPE